MSEFTTDPVTTDPVTTELQIVDVTPATSDVTPEETNEKTLKMRAERIRAIVQTAFAETTAELKGGSGEIRAIAKETLSDLFAVDTNPSQQTVTQVTVDTPETTSPSNEPSLLSLVVQLVRLQWANHLQRPFDQFKNRFGQFDKQLNEGQREQYQTSREALDRAIAWYRSTMAKANTIEPNLVEQQQAEFETKAGTVGIKMAQREQQIKQQVKQWLGSAVAKL